MAFVCVRTTDFQPRFFMRVGSGVSSLCTNDCVFNHEEHQKALNRLIASPWSRNDWQFYKIPDNYVEKIGLTEEKILSVLDNYDGIAACNDTKQSIRSYNETHFSQDIKYYNKTLEIIDKDWPEIAPAAHQYEKETYHSWSQCFVIKKETFFKYCDFLFDVLQKLDDFCKDDYKKLSIEQQRILGYAAENLWGIYWRYLTNSGMRFKCVPLVVNNNPFIEI